MVRFTSVVCVLLAVVYFDDGVYAHSNMVLPQPKWPEGFSAQNSPSGTIEGDKFASSVPSYQGVNKITKAMEEEGVKTLREFVMKHQKPETGATKECGTTILTGGKQPLPEAVDFPWGHPGPCEMWCDNNRFFFDKDCVGNKIGKVPVDKAKCAGASILQGMYVGVHASIWQVYADCAPLVGGTSTDVTSLTASAPAEGGAAAAAAPSTGSIAPASSPATASTSSAGVAATPTVAPAPATPTAPKTKCRARRY
ncbi:hypothetical protein Poli38472_001969 [Pythium oligandrum]|uniref:Uncharacterized protein n=1 Tax=Pythium oligandrum TaxID=41045 RepID=A0A8K1CVQ1_PYTOL|nr:hypothetical protein Poli38472_001969 [Pythium oligandrum]|eukprot:TMW69813.1 hypothetical protein Poli38472_001969 [Pythium oligandrum]